MMQENKRHFFGKCMLFGVFVFAGLCSVAIKAMNEGAHGLSEHEIALIARTVQEFKAAEKKPSESFLKSFTRRLFNMDKRRALLIAVPTVAIAICMTPSVRTLAHQGVQSVHIAGLKLWRALPWSRIKKEALTGEIEALESANKKRGDECPEFKIKETLDNVKWSGAMIGFTVLFLDCLLGEDATKLK